MIDSSTLVSIIIPVYNVVPYLKQALDSVINQSYRNLEIIIVEDGSTDGSSDICEEYAKKDDRIRLIHQENKGLSAARNRGLDIMTGFAVAFLDPDDALHPDYIQAMLNAMKHENVDMVVCKYTIHYTTGNLEVTEKDRIFPFLQPGVIERKTVIHALITGTLNNYVWNKLYKSNLWDRIRFLEGHVYEDVEIDYRISSCCEKVYVMEQALYLYRKHFGSITHTVTLRNCQDRLLSYNRVLSYIQENIPAIFSDEQLFMWKQKMVKNMVILYLKAEGIKETNRDVFCNELKRQIIIIGGETGLGNDRQGVRIAYWMIWHCPHLLHAIYPVYRTARIFIWKIFKR